jgi:hypothetical protein
MTFPMPGNGDLTIAWDAANHDAMIGHIQALIDRGVAFYKLSEAGYIGKKVCCSTERKAGCGGAIRASC